MSTSTEECSSALLGPVMLDVAGTSLSEAEKTVLLNPLVGGVIFFARNYESKSQLEALVAQIRECRPGILISVDQEGGRVQRFRSEFQPLPSLQRIANYALERPNQEAEILRCFGWLMAEEVLATGIDFSFAPVLDLDDHQCPAIMDRSFSPDPDICIRFAQYYIEGMHAAGMAATAKHFPGHGLMRVDSHLELPTDERGLEELESRDLKPFRELAHIFDAVMPGHLLFPNVDQHPVGFSSFWLKDVLRDSLGFQGVIVSDDLSMQGASAMGGYSRRAELALQAGCDILLVCNNPDGAHEVLKWLESADLPDRGESQTRLAAMRAGRERTKNSVLSSEIPARALYHMSQLQNGA